MLYNTQMNKLLWLILIVIIGAAIWMHGGKALYESYASPQEQVTEAQAAAEVQNLPEVAQYIAAIRTAGGDPRVVANNVLQRYDGSLGTYWQVKVYQQFSGYTQPDSTYDVNSKTGAVTQEF
jgi:hypothetical protein